MPDKQTIETESVLDKHKKIEQDLEDLKRQKEFLLQLIYSKEQELKEIFGMNNEKSND